MNIVLYLAEAFFVAYLMRVVAFRLNFPVVSAYVVGGVLLGGSLFIWMPGGVEFQNHWLFNGESLEELGFITHIALGAIALGIGAELEWKRIKTLGRSIIAIAVCEAFGAFLLVFISVLLIWRDLPFAILLGAVSSATAPAATVAVIQQYKAKGPLTKTILAVVGIDDAISFILFAFAITVAKSSMEGSPINIMTGVVRPVADIVLSLAIGGAIGLAGARLLTMTHDHESGVFVLAAIVLWVTAIAEILDLSELLANMASGIIIVNTYPMLKNRIRTIFASFMPIFYALFFIIGGAYLNLMAFPSIWLFAIVYFFARSAGKILGASTGAVIGNALPQVRRWIGFDLLPQVGAAIALALLVNADFGDGQYGMRGNEMAEDIMNILLVTTFITEFIGPYLTKLSLFKTGEARE